jgi:multidrug efflux system membrane fusion protein
MDPHSGGEPGTDDGGVSGKSRAPQGQRDPPAAEEEQAGGAHARQVRWRTRLSQPGVLWTLVGLWALAAILLWRIGSERERAAAAAAAAHQTRTPITVGHSRSGDMNVYVSALGTVTPIYTVTVFSQVTGRVTEVHYREGQMVSKGDPLIDIDARIYEAMLAQAEGNLRHDRALLAQARIDLARYAAAAAKNAIPRQQLDDQQQAVLQFEGAVQADEGAVALNKVQVEYCHIMAPISGRVGLRLVDPGNTVFAGSGSTLVVITQLQPITVVFSLSEDDLPQVQDALRSGHTLRVDAFDRADRHPLEAGELTSLDNQIDTTTGTLRLRAQFPNDELRLFPNQFVNARLLVRTLNQATLVPTTALQYNGTAAFVYRVQTDNTVTVQPVNPVTSNESETAVEGLGTGVAVATSGFDRLESGVAVQIRQASAPASAMPGLAPRASQTIHPTGVGASSGSQAPAGPGRQP